MTEDAQNADTDETLAPKKPIRRAFRSSYGAIPFARDSAERQSKAALLAWEVLGGREPATEFLNNHNEELGARPIDLAIANAEGLDAVKQALDNHRNAVKP